MLLHVLGLSKGLPAPNVARMVLSTLLERENSGLIFLLLLSSLGMRAIALGFFVSSTAAFVQFPQFPAPARCIPRVLSAAPVAQGGAFGMDPREIKVLRYGFEQLEVLCCTRLTGEFGNACSHSGYPR